VETALIFVIATSAVAAVVWWASSPPGGPHRKSRPRPRLSFQETFQTTGPEPIAPVSPAAEEGDGFVLMTPSHAAPLAPDDRPNPVLSVVRLALTITLVSLVAVAVLGGLGLFLFRLIDGYFARGGV
jgi:hypothetical protein